MDCESQGQTLRKATSEALHCVWREQISLKCSSQLTKQINKQHEFVKVQGRRGLDIEKCYNILPKVSCFQQNYKA